MYLLRLSLRPWRLAPFSQIFSSLAVGFLLLLVGFLFWMQRGLKPILTRLQGEQVVTAYLDPSVNGKDAQALVDTIRVSMGAHSQSARAPEIKLVTSFELISLLKSQYPDLGRELEDLGNEMDQIVPRYVSVSGVLPSDSVDQIKRIPGVESAESSKDRYKHIVGAFSALRTVARVLMAGLCLALLTGLIHLARMNGFLHRDALLLLRFWGAGSATLLVPGMISGLFVGLLGGVIAFSGWLTAGIWLTRHVRALSPMLSALPMAGSQSALVLLFLGGSLGWLAGGFGSLGSATQSSSRTEGGLEA